MYAIHRRVTWTGTFGPKAAPLEGWSFRLNTAGVIDNVDLTTYLPGLIAAWTTHLAPRQQAHTRLTEVKVATIGADGRYTSDPAIADVDVVATGSSSATWPFQIALAVSLNTAKRGPSGKGRFYLAAPSLSVASDGAVSDATRDTFATSAQAFLNAVNGVAGLGNVVVASTKGENHVVTGVRVGRILDTMRSRRRSLEEAYDAPLPVTPGA